MEVRNMKQIKTHEDLWRLVANEQGEYTSKKSGLTYKFTKDSECKQGDGAYNAEFNMVTISVLRGGKEIGYIDDDTHVEDISLDNLDDMKFLDKEEQPFVPSIALATEEIENLIELCLKNHSLTAWHTLEKTDEGEYAIVMGYRDGFDKGEKDRYGENGERLCMKVAYLPKNSVMSEYSIDWVMPWYPGGEDGEIYDTEVSLYSGTNIYSTVEWLVGEYKAFVELKEKDEQAREESEPDR